jgi:hypothetical protein
MQPEQEQQPSANNNYQPQPDDAATQQQQHAEQLRPQAEPIQTAPLQPVQSTPAHEPTQQQMPQYAPAQSPSPQQSTEDPGKVYSILGLVAAFIVMQVPGLILSIIGYKKSKKAGHRTTLATIGIWLNAIGLVLSVAVMAFFIWAAYTGVQERSANSAQKTAAMEILKKAEMYSANNSNDKYAYPTIEQLRSAPAELALTEAESANLKDTDQPKGDEIGYKTCTDSNGTVIGAKTYIYSEVSQRAIYHGIAGSCDL